MSIIWYIFLFFMFLSTVFSGSEINNEPVPTKSDNQHEAVEIKNGIEIKNNKTIFETFMNDNNLEKCTFLKCDQFKRIMSLCHQQYSDKCTQFSRVYYETVKIYFCMAYYDIALQICHIYNTVNVQHQFKIKEYFKQNLMNYTMSSKKYENEMCKNFVNVFYKKNTFPQTKEWSLEKHLNEPECKLLCIDSKNINNDCVVIYELFTFINSIVNTPAPYTKDSDILTKPSDIITKKPVDSNNKKQLLAVNKLMNKIKEIVVSTSTEKIKNDKYVENQLETDTKNIKISNDETVEVTKQVNIHKNPMSISITEFTSKQYSDTNAYASDNDDPNNDADLDDNMSPGDGSLSVVNVDVSSVGSKLSEGGSDESYVPYFFLLSVSCVIGYIIIVNKHKILALAVEGRPNRLHRRRPNTANYRKLDSNLEEAVTSNCNNSVSHVIY